MCDLIHFQNILSSTEAENAKGRDYTVGIAVAGSILDNAQTQEMRTYLAGANFQFLYEEINNFN